MANVAVSAKHLKTAQDLGALRNALGILSTDRKKINTNALQKVTGLGPSALEKTTKISRPMFYRGEIQIPAQLMEKVIMIVMVTDLALELLGNNRDETAKWLMLPNTMLFGATPFEVCLRGEAAHLIEWLNQRLGKTNL